MVPFPVAVAPCSGPGPQGTRRVLSESGEGSWLRRGASGRARLGPPQCCCVQGPPQARRRGGAVQGPAAVLPPQECPPAPLPGGHCPLPRPRCCSQSWALEIRMAAVPWRRLSLGVLGRTPQRWGTEAEVLGAAWSCCFRGTSLGGPSPGGWSANPKCCAHPPALCCLGVSSWGRAQYSVWGFPVSRGVRAAE